MGRSSFFYGLLAFLCLGACAASVQAQDLRWDEFDRIAQNYIKKNKNSGLLIGILRGGQMELRGYGVRSRSDPQPPDRHSLFEIGGLTSVFTTSAVMLAGRDHAFHIDDPLSLYLEVPAPVFQPQICTEVRLPNRERYVGCRPDPLAEAICISLCDLATHTSGLTCSCNEGYTWNPFVQIDYRDDVFFDQTREDFYFSLNDYELKTEPGVVFRYSNIGMSLLGHLVADISGLSYADLIGRYVAVPLELENTVVRPRDDQASCRLQGHNARGRSVEPWTFDAMLPAAGLHSTGEDLLKFLQANISSGDPALDALLEQVQQARVDVEFLGWPRSTQAGYGWLISTLNDETNLPVHWINGGTGGFRAWMGFVKDTKTAVVVLSNSARQVDDLAWEIMESLHPVRP